MAKTADLDFLVLPNSPFYPLEPIHEGALATRRGHRDAALNANWITRHLRPQMVLDYCRKPTTTYIGASQQVAPGAPTVRQVWRLPRFPSIQAAPRLDVHAWVEAAAGSAGHLRLDTLGAPGSTTLDINPTGVWHEVTGNLAYDPTVDETLTLSIWRDAGAGEVAVKSVSVWPQNGDDPLPGTGLGLDVLAYAQDLPLATHQQRYLLGQMQAALNHCRGVMVSRSGDQIDLRDFYTAATQNYTYHLPMRYGPGTTALRVYVNGQGELGNTVTLSTDTGGSLVLSLVLPAAWTPTGSWQTGLLAVPPGLGQKQDTLNLQLFAAAGTSRISGICIWEAPS